MSYNVLDISYFIINKHNELCKNRGITNLRLQKLLYFTQCNFIIEKNKPCFEEKIVAWPYGPVVVEAYDKFKIYGNLKITTNYDYEKIDIDDKDKEYIIDVIKNFKYMNDFELVDLTHNQSPWINASEKGINTEITIDAIEEFFLRK